MQQSSEPGRRSRLPADTIEPTLPLDMPRSEKPEPRPSGGKRSRPAPVAPAADLFGTDADIAGTSMDAIPDTGSEPKRKRSKGAAHAAPDASAGTPGTAAEPAPKRKPRKDAAPMPAPGAPPLDHATSPGTTAPQTEPVSGPDSETEPPDAACSTVEQTEHEDADQPRPHGAVMLSPDEVLLQKVEPRSFRPNERNDSWLYWLTDRFRADAALRDGMPVEPDAPLLLSDRRAVLPKLAALAEDPDWAPNAIAVLRLRRIAVEPLLRPGPEPDSYVLAGAAANVSA